MGARDENLLQMAAPALEPGTARVLAVDQSGRQCVLQVGDQTWTARRAASCLVLPRVGDLVAHVGTEAGASHVTAVLERAAGVPLTLCLPAGSVIAAQDGALTLQADALTLAARSFHLEAEQAQLNVEQVNAVGRKASWSYSAVKVTTELLESFAERVLQFARWSQRMIDGPDQVRSRQIDYRAEQILQLQAHTVIANADKLFKADGEQIHIG